MKYWEMAEIKEFWWDLRNVWPPWGKNNTFHKLHRQKRKLAAKPELHVLTFTSGNCLDILQKFHSIKALLPPLEEISSIAFPFSVFRKDNMTRIIKPTFYKFRKIILTYLFTNWLLSQWHFQPWYFVTNIVLT